MFLEIHLRWAILDRFAFSNYDIREQIVSNQKSIFVHSKHTNDWLYGYNEHYADPEKSTMKWKRTATGKLNFFMVKKRRKKIKHLDSIKNDATEVRKSRFR